MNLKEMTMDPNDRLNPEFASFVQRTAPAWLKDGTPPPDGIPDSDWRSLQERAREHFVAKASYDFCELVASRGWRPGEAATGQLDGRASVGLLDGSVRRVEPQTDPQLRQRAVAVLERARRARHALDPITLVDLESMARGSWGGRGGQGKISAAEAEVAAAERAAVTAQSEETARPVIEVGVGFRALGKTFPAGRYAIEPQQLRDLETWQAKLTAQAASHGWPEPVGFERKPWPPFRVVQGAGSADPAQTVTLGEKGVFA